MQSRQHFELYFWLHTEYVLLPALESNETTFWSLSHILIQKCLTESKAITMVTKKALQNTAESKAKRRTGVRSEPMLKDYLIKAQQEIFVMLEASRYDRFCKSNLYKMVLRDPLLTWARTGGRNDGFTDLMSYERLPKNTGNLHGQSATKLVICEDVELNECERTGSPNTEHSDLGDTIESPPSSDSGFLGLNLESIIRFTDLPEGLQVHYRPKYNIANNTLLECCDESTLIKAFIFEASSGHHSATNTHQSCDLEIHQVHIDQKVSKSVEDFHDLSTRLKPFFVPDGQLTISKTSKCPGDMLFCFQQTGQHGLMNAAVFLTYQDMLNVVSEEKERRARGLSFVSRIISATTLRTLLQQYLSDHEACDYMCSKQLVKHFANQHPLQMAKLGHSPTLSSPVNGACYDTTLEPLVQFFGTTGMLQLLACALLECSIVFVSDQYSALTNCAEGIRSLLKPFQWCHVYLPILPKSLLAYLECPTPFLAGIHTNYAHESIFPKSGSVAIANTETGMIYYTGRKCTNWQNLGICVHDADVSLPFAFKDTKHALDRLLNPFLFDLDTVNPKPANNHVYRTPFPDGKIRRECRSLIEHLLQGHMDARLIVGDVREFVVIFDEEQFLASKSAEGITFYRMLLRTQSFSEYIGVSSTPLQTT